MEVQHKYIISRLAFPVECYNYTVDTWTSIDNGQTFYYCGNSKYFKTLSQARKYQKERQAEK